MKAKILIIRTLVFIAGILMSATSFAQEKDYTYRRLESLLVTHLSGYGRSVLDKDILSKNKAFLFGVGIYVNENGKADSIWYTNETRELDSLVGFKMVTMDIKKHPDAFKDKRNTVLLGVAYFRRSWDNQISNLDSFDSAFTTVIPEIPKQYLGKKIILFPAFNLVQAEGSIN